MNTRTNDQSAARFSVSLSKCRAALLGVFVSFLFQAVPCLEAQTTYSVNITTSATTWSGLGLSSATSSDTVNLTANLSSTLSLDTNPAIGVFNYNNSTTGGAGTLIISPNSSVNRSFTAGDLNFTSNSTSILRFTNFNSAGGNLSVSIGNLTIAAGVLSTRGIQIGSQVNPSGQTLLGNFTANNTILNAGLIAIGATRNSTLTPLNVHLGNITMTGGTISLSETVGGFSNIILANSLNGSAGTIRVAGNPSPSPLQGTLRLVGNQTTTFSGVLQNGGANGTLLLEYAGTGRQTLNGTNTYSGNTTISSGTLQFARTASLYNGASANWTASRIKVGSNATVAFNVGGTNEFSTGNVTTLLANLGGANGSSSGGLAEGSAIGFDTTNASGSSFTISDNIANSSGTGGGAIGLAKLGANTLVLSGNNTYTGATTILAGTLAAGGALAIGDASAVSISSGASLNLLASETVGSIAGGGNITLGGNTLTVGSNNANTTFSGNLSGIGGGLAKNGTGTLTLSGSSSNTGETAVNGGTLVVNGAHAPAITVASGATLGGNGTVNGLTTLNSGATLSPGNSVGTLTLAGGLTLNSTSTVTMEINGSTAGEFDTINVTVGPLTYGGTLSIAFAGGYAPDVNSTYALFTGASAATATGNFTNLIFNKDGYQGTFESANGTLTLTAVPEPSASVLVPIALLALLTAAKISGNLRAGHGCSGSNKGSAFTRRGPLA